MAQDQLLKFPHSAQIGIGGQVDLDQRPLGSAKGRQIVVGSQGLANLDRADIVSGQAIRLQPDAHGKGTRTEDVRPLHPCQGGEARLHHPHQVICNLVLQQLFGTEAEISRGKLTVGRDDIEGRHFGFGREIGPHLVDLGADLGQRLGGILIQFEVNVDSRETKGALRFDIVDAIGSCNDPFQRSRNEAPHQISAGPDIDGGYGNRRVLAARILTNIERAQSLHTGNDDQQGDDHGQNRTTNKQVSKFHDKLIFSLSCRRMAPTGVDRMPADQSSFGLGASLNWGASLLSSTTDCPLRNLKTPVVTTVSSPFRPEAIATKSPRFSPSRTNC